MNIFNIKYPVTTIKEDKIDCPNQINPSKHILFVHTLEQGEPILHMENGWVGPL